MESHVLANPWCLPESICPSLHFALRNPSVGRMNLSWVLLEESTKYWKHNSNSGAGSLSLLFIGSLESLELPSNRTHFTNQNPNMPSCTMGFWCVGLCHPIVFQGWNQIPQVIVSLLEGRQSAVGFRESTMWRVEACPWQQSLWWGLCIDQNRSQKRYSMVNR